MQVREQDLVEREKGGHIVEAIAAGSRVKFNASSTWRGRRRCQAKYSIVFNALDFLVIRGDRRTWPRGVHLSQQIGRVRPGQKSTEERSSEHVA
jgi:hypothetical protein